MTVAFGKTLQVVMKNKNIPAKKLAEMSGVQPSYISLLINGKIKEPTWVKACALITALDFTVDEFRQLQNVDNQKDVLAVDDDRFANELSLLINFKRTDKDCQECISKIVKAIADNKVKE